MFRSFHSCAYWPSVWMTIFCTIFSNGISLHSESLSLVIILPLCKSYKAPLNVLVSDCLLLSTLFTVWLKFLSLLDICTAASYFLHSLPTWSKAQLCPEEPRLNCAPRTRSGEGLTREQKAPGQGWSTCPLEGKHPQHWNLSLGAADGVRAAGVGGGWETLGPGHVAQGHPRTSFPPSHGS